jgi:hypothetical protein
VGRVHREAESLHGSLGDRMNLLDRLDEALEDYDSPFWRSPDIEEAISTIRRLLDVNAAMVERVSTLHCSLPHRVERRLIVEYLHKLEDPFASELAMAIDRGEHLR